MEAQTGRYRLGLASNLPAKQGCLEEMTPFQSLNYNKSQCALQKHTHFNTPNSLLLNPGVIFIFLKVTHVALFSCFYFVATF